MCVRVGGTSGGGWWGGGGAGASWGPLELKRVWPHSSCLLHQRSLLVKAIVGRQGAHHAGNKFQEKRDMDLLIAIKTYTP